MATDFLWAGGTSNNGLLTAAVTLMSTELNSVVNAGTAVSSVGGASTTGVFKNSDFAQAMIGNLYLTLGTISSAVSAGGNVAGWWLESPDGGTTYENTVSGAAQARPPDFILPVPATTITSGWVFPGVLVRVPALVTKVFIQNNLGQTLASSGNTIKLGVFGMQY